VFARSPALRSARPLAAVVAVVALLLGACNSAPAAPALTDPKDILTHAVTSLQNLTTAEVTGSFTGSVNAPQIGNFDLSTIKLTAAIDVPNKKAKAAVDAPTLLGTKVDALLVGDTAYYKIAGPLAAMVQASADKYTKVDVPTPSAQPSGDIAGMAQAVDQIKAGLDKLPTPPTKQADEKCGDQDCYHVTIKLTAADLKQMDATSTLDGDVTMDVWTRKSDYRPAKLTVGVASASLGTVGMTFEFTYGGSVSVDAPPADQVVSP
jgi:hypothetical protein